MEFTVCDFLFLFNYVYNYFFNHSDFLFSTNGLFTKFIIVLLVSIIFGCVIHWLKWEKMEEEFSQENNK